jgi:DNA helicase-2/ATP-dependent DNA helicase PcrA
LELIRRWYEPHLERICDDAHVRAADLVQLEQIAAAIRHANGS